MSLSIIENPFDTFLSLVGGGLSGGDVYIGVENMDPQTNPQAVYWDADGTIPAAQPLEVQGGYVMRLGTPARAYVNNNYSIRVLDRFGVQVFYAASVPLLSADTITFLQAGTGAATRTLQSKLRDIVNVRDFGAVGDGVADDTVEIQAAIDSFGTAGGTLMFPPGGTYIISASLKPRAKVEMFAPKGTVTIKQAAGTNLPALFDFDANAADGATLDGLIIDGNWLNNSRSMATERFACYVATADDVTIRNCEIRNYTGNGVYVSDGLRPTVVDSYLHNLSFYGVIVTRSSFGALNYPVVTGNRLENVAWHAIGFSRCIGGRIENNDLYGIHTVGQVVNVVGTTVTWVSGPDFSTIEPGNFIIYNGGFEALISAKVSSTQLTLSTAPGDAAATPAACGAADMIGSVSSQDTLIAGNRIVGGASLGISVVGTTATGDDGGAMVLNNQIVSLGSAGISIQTAGAGIVRDAIVSGNRATECGLNTTASAADFNAGCTVSGLAQSIQVTNNDFVSYGSAMYGLNILTTGAEVQTSGNRHRVASGAIQNGATISLGGGWNGAVVSAVKVNDDVVSFLVTTSATPPAASPALTITHRNIPCRGKAASAQIVATSNVPLPVGTGFPEGQTTTLLTVLGTPSASTTYQFVCRM